MYGRSSVATIGVGLVLLFLAGGDDVRAAATRLPDDAHAELMKPHDFKTVKRVDQIPDPALSAFHAKQDDKDYRMANPKERFAVGKDAADKTLPPRQLLFAAISPDYVLIAHARGSYALGYYYVLVKKTGKAYSVIWVGEGSRFSTFHKFEKSLKGPDIDDRAGYAY